METFEVIIAMATGILTILGVVGGWVLKGLNNKIDSVVEPVKDKVESVERASEIKDKELKRDLDEKFKQLREIDYDQQDEYHKIIDKMRDIEVEAYKDFMLKEDFHKWRERIKDEKN